MRIWKSRNGNPTTGRQQPSEEVRDLLMDFGDRERRGDSLWLTLRRETLPGYLRNLRVAKEACRWVMVLSAGGSTVLCFKRGGTRILGPRRVRT